MAARKTKRKTSAAGAKKTTKAASAKKTTKASTAKKTTKASTAKKTTKAAGVKKPADAKDGASKPAGASISSKSVNMGNVFALRPRANTSFRQEDFLAARRALEDETYASVEEAARAVVERALELSNDPGGKLGRKRRR